MARAFVPGAETLEVMDQKGKSLGTLARRHPAGFFEGTLKLKERQALSFLAANAQGRWTVADAYLLGPVLGPLDDYYIGEGNHLRLHDRLGRTRCSTKAMTACISRCGRPMPRAFRWSATSITGTDAGT